MALEKVSYTYPTQAVDPVLRDVDLVLNPGEYLLICGASGSGKSTLARTFNGLIPHYYGGRMAGRVVVDGRDTREVSVADLFHHVALVFQNPKTQLFNRSVTQELVFGLESLGLSPPAMQARLASITAEMGLEPLLARNPRTLSGGEQQMVAIAAVLALQPRIVVLDEPMANLDAAHIDRLRTLLRQIRQRGTGVVVCEHRLAPTLSDADRVVVVQRGRKLLDGSAPQTAADPTWPEQEIELPLAVRLGRHRGWRPLPLTIDDLPADAPAILGEAPWVPSAAAPAPGAARVRLDRVGFDLEGRPLVDELSFTLHEGQISALVGANGAGKTTVVKLINGLAKPSRGRIELYGRDSRDLRPWQVARQVGTAFQNPNSQFFKLTVEEEILVGPTIQNRLDRRWIDELIAIFRLEHLLHRAPFKLSGGEKKRVAFAAALATKPQLLALDEPTAGQDSQFRQALIDCLRQLKAHGTTILLVTHALNFVEAIADRWLVMASGRLIADGPPDAVMSQADILRQAGLAPTEAYRWRMKCRATP